MMLKYVRRVVVGCLVAGAAIACDESGSETVTQPPPLAGLRYVNAVSDTGAVDLRVVDLEAAIQVDQPPAAVSGQIAVRTWQLASTLDPSATTPLDVWIVAPGSGALSGPPTIAGQSYPDTSSYAGMPTGTYRVAFTAAGTTAPILFQANMPSGGAGVAGTTVAGSAVTVVVVPRSIPGSSAPSHFTDIQAISSLVSNADTTGTAVTAAPHNLETGASVIINGADTAVYNGTFAITVVDPTTFTYKMLRTTTGSPATGYVFWRPASAGSSFNGLPVSRLTSSGTAATLVTLSPHGLATNDIATIGGANEPEYNGSFAVTRLDATTVTYTTNGTPGASPATGTPVWRRGVDDFTRPNVMFLIDR